MLWESTTQNILFCPSGAGHSCGNPTAGLSANCKSTAASGYSSVEAIACNNLTNSELMLNRYSWQYFQSMVICFNPLLIYIKLSSQIVLTHFNILSWPSLTTLPFQHSSINCKLIMSLNLSFLSSHPWPRLHSLKNCLCCHSFNAALGCLFHSNWKIRTPPAVLCYSG